MERGVWTIGGNTYTLDVSDIPADREPDVTLAQKIQFASDVLDRKAELLKELGDVRELCTLLVNTGSGDREQVAWVRFYLPRKTRGKGGNGSDEETSPADEAAEVTA
jgi:hypothetical protein